MAGPQHPFPTGFPNAQQNTLRNQFGGGQMVSGLMGPQQGMMSPQQFGAGVGAGMVPNSLGMLPNAQQVMNQQQPVHPQLQPHQQQMHLQQQSALVQQNNQSSGAAATPQIPVPQPQPTQQRQNAKDFNTATLCKLGQETVQEIVNRMMEVFTQLKTIQPPNGTPQGQSTSNDKKLKVQDQIKTISLLFKRLRVIYEKCNENSQLQGMEYTHIESLIPIKEEWDMKSDEKKTSEAYRVACEEHKEVMEQVILKNRHLKEIIDHLRRIISEINTMMSMRRS
ncbi:mediator of RNA polymerase II transcription subunit 30 isoform X2 [Copidosoma floridanum]|uniref:mediator of RNA polymerase II transcription subunit 30 isoform X2 n=1 Tax=Copidosoma floridanum TaxID=29053 RepID=UPI000C6FBC36|nr:mediator of RNA polymerase II transcription subunit 30 isoform X2 [Copidosoma floridanum]